MRGGGKFKKWKYVRFYMWSAATTDSVCYYSLYFFGEWNTVDSMRCSRASYGVIIELYSRDDYDAFLCVGMKRDLSFFSSLYFFFICKFF